MKNAHAQFLATVFLTLTTGATCQANESFTVCRPETNGEVFLQFSAPTGQVCHLEVSNNLRTWQRAVTWLPAKSALTYLDPAAPFNRQRFYRFLSVPETNAALGDHFPTTEDEVVIRQVSVGTLLLAWGEKHIYVDPTPDNIGITPNSNFRGLPQADLVLITHDHPDHLEQGSAPALRGLLTPQTQIICSLGAFNAYLGTQSSAYLKTNILRSLSGVTVLTNGATTQAMGIAIQAVPSYNFSSAYHPRTANYNGYLITLGGQRFYFSGDTDAIPEMLALKDIDFAFIPIYGGGAVLDSAEAAKAVRQFHPRIVYPYHRQLGQEYTFKRLLGTAAGIEVRVSNW